MYLHWIGAIGAYRCQWNDRTLPKTFKAWIRHKHCLVLWPLSLQQATAVVSAISGCMLWYGCHPNESTHFLRAITWPLLDCDKHESSDLEVKSYLLLLKPFSLDDFNRLWNFKTFSPSSPAPHLHTRQPYHFSFKFHSNLTTKELFRLQSVWCAQPTDSSCPCLLTLCGICTIVKESFSQTPSS